MEWNHVTIGAVLVVLGIFAFVAAVDVVTSLPGNFLFFGGVMTMTWGSENPAAQGFFWMAVASILFIVVTISAAIYRARTQKSNRIDH